MFSADPNFWIGQRVWIVGSSTGIGLGLAQALSEASAFTIVSARSQELLDDFVTANRADGRSALAVPLDVTDTDSVFRGFAKIEDLVGGVDILIYSAGSWYPTDLPSFDANQALQQMEVNYQGLLRCVAMVLPGMTHRQTGTIVGISSASAYAPLPRAEAYGATKAAMMYFLQSLRLDARRFGLKVITVSPGFVDTGLTRKNDFRMPFMVSVESATSTILSGIQQGKSEIHGPKRLTIPLKLLGSLPRPAKEWVIRRYFHL